MAGGSDACDAVCPSEHSVDRPVMKGFFQHSPPKPEDQYKSVAGLEQRERGIRIMNGAAGLTGLIFLLLVMAYLVVIAAILLFGRIVCLAWKLRCSGTGYSCSSW